MDCSLLFIYNINIFTCDDIDFALSFCDIVQSIKIADEELFPEEQDCTTEDDLKYSENCQLNL